jgi:U3 small nucleolar RNA-associated protein 7
MTHTFPGVPVHDVRFCPFDDVLGVGHSAGFTSLIVPGAGEPNFDSLEADPYEGKRRRREREVNSLLDKVPFDMITLDPDLVGQLDRSAIRSADDATLGTGAAGNAALLRRPQAQDTPYARKSRLERLRIDGDAVLAEDDAFLAAGDDDEDDLDDEEKDKLRRDARQKAREDKADAKKRARGRNSTLKKMLRRKRRNVIDPQTVAIKEKLERQRAASKKAKQDALAERSAQSGTAGALDRFAFK